MIKYNKKIPFTWRGAVFGLSPEDYRKLKSGEPVKVSPEVQEWMLKTGAFDLVTKKIKEDKHGGAK